MQPLQRGMTSMNRAGTLYGISNRNFIFAAQAACLLPKCLLFGSGERRWSAIGRDASWSQCKFAIF
jgi:hypothetical protein